jgi:hypothetical protein
MRLTSIAQVREDHILGYDLQARRHSHHGFLCLLRAAGRHRPTSARIVARNPAPHGPDRGWRVGRWWAVVLQAEAHRLGRPAEPAPPAIPSTVDGLTGTPTLPGMRVRLAPQPTREPAAKPDRLQFEIGDDCGITDKNLT